MAIANDSVQIRRGWETVYACVPAYSGMTAGGKAVTRTARVLPPLLTIGDGRRSKYRGRGHVLVVNRRVRTEHNPLVVSVLKAIFAAICFRRRFTLYCDFSVITI